MCPRLKTFKMNTPKQKKRIGNLWLTKVITFLYLSIRLWSNVLCISLFRFRVGSTYYWVDCTLGNSRIIGSGKEYHPQKLMQANHVILLCKILSKKVNCRLCLKEQKKIHFDFQFQYFGVWYLVLFLNLKIFIFAYDMRYIYIMKLYVIL